MTSYYQGTIYELSKPEATSGRLGLGEIHEARRSEVARASWRAASASGPTSSRHPRVSTSSKRNEVRAPETGRRENGSTAQPLNGSTFPTCVN